LRHASISGALRKPLRDVLAVDRRRPGCDSPAWPSRGGSAASTMPGQICCIDFDAGRAARAPDAAAC
jgi:hypothetical protein